MKRTKTRASKALVPVLPKYIAKIRRDRLDVQEDPTVQLMGMLGLSYRAIKIETRLSDYQIATRLKKMGIKLKDYRDAVSPIGQQVLRKINYLAEKRIVDHIERHLLK